MTSLIGLIKIIKMIGLKYMFSVILILIFQVGFGQKPNQRYITLIKSAERYYFLKNYKQSAATYSSAFKANKGEALPEHRYNAACAWAMTDNKDSAFHQLNILANKANYSDYEKIFSEPNLMTIHKDKRWKPLLLLIQKNIEKKEGLLNKPLIKLIDSIYNDDQNLRMEVIEIQKNGSNSKEIKEKWKIIKEKDSVNLLKVKNIIENYGWLGADVIGEKGNQFLFLVIQNSDQKTREKYLPIMREAVKKGDAKASTLALLEDKVALGQGKKQIYGSQIITDNETGESKIAPIEDSLNVNRRRANVGLEPLENYAAQWGLVLKTKEVVKKEKILNNDFATAIEIQDSVVGPVNTARGYGKQREFYYNGDLKEENSVWFKLTIDRDTILTFDIVPLDSYDDYDFMIFKCSSPDCIEKIKTNAIKPDRWCFSVNYDKNGSTGLSEHTNNSYLYSGPGNGYVSAIKAKAGDTFYLMVNWPAIYNRTPKGFKIYFYNYWRHKPKRFADQKTLNHSTKPKQIVLENVQFETNKSILLPDSKLVLDKLVAEMKKNKNMEIEVRGYTDNTGDEKQNQFLSENRARAVVYYLISKNIDKSRLSYKGLGSSKPIASNDTEEGRNKNRRVEFIILRI